MTPTRRQQPQRSVAGLRDPVCAARSRSSVQPRDDARGIDRGCARDRARFPCVGDQRGRSELAQPEARRAQPAPSAVAARGPFRADRSGEVIADPLRPCQPARDVVADMGHHRRSRRRRIQGVERGHPVGLCRRDREPSRDVVQRGLADPADAVLDRVEGGQQLRAPRTDGVTAARRVALGAGTPRSADPARLRRSEDGVDRRPFGRRGEGPDDVQVHRARV